ncbi:MAG: helix-turn-helix transcriptional regulator [Bacillota bacterium]|nr:helix-turn-helix transcriptional regulator [Bacillota bacterium]
MRNEVGKLIKKALIDRGMTQLELAQRTGISYNYLSLIVRGVRAPGKYAAALAQELGIEEEALRRAAS